MAIAASLSPLRQTSIGAVAAILGGILGAVVSYQMALRLLRRERRDDALLEIVGLLPNIRFNIDSLLREHDEAPDQMLQTRVWWDVRTPWLRLEQRWVEALRPRIHDSKTRRWFEAARRSLAVAAKVNDAVVEPVPPPEEFWAELKGFDDALNAVQTRADVLLGRRRLWPRRRGRGTD